MQCIYHSNCFRIVCVQIWLFWIMLFYLYELCIFKQLVQVFSVSSLAVASKLIRLVKNILMDTVWKKKPISGSPVANVGITLSFGVPSGSEKREERNKQSKTHQNNSHVFESKHLLSWKPSFFFSPGASRQLWAELCYIDWKWTDRIW